MAIDLFADIRKQEAELHPQYRVLRDELAYAPARGLICELQASFTDPDGNFVEQFQTFGFDSRTFELFVFAMLSHSGHSIDRTIDRPDFLITKDGITAAVEAVTANPATSGKIQPYQVFGDAVEGDGLATNLEHMVPVRLGSPLYSKLSMKYWELPHVKGRPFVLAIQDFHAPGSLATSSAPLTNYLYGFGQRWWHDDAGNLVIDYHEVAAHKRPGKSDIPSGFFRQAGAENVSAVLFCNSGTIAKFNRMGHQGDYKTRGVRMLRWGTRYQHDPNASMPIPFLYEVGAPEGHEETWGEGTVLIHNPYALYPLPQQWMGAAVEQTLSNDQVVTIALERFLPYMSQTYILTNASRGDVRKQGDELWRRLLASLSHAGPVAAKFGKR